MLQALNLKRAARRRVYVQTLPTLKSIPTSSALPFLPNLDKTLTLKQLRRLDLVKSIFVSLKAKRWDFKSTVILIFLSDRRPGLMHTLLEQISMTAGIEATRTSFSERGKLTQLSTVRS